MAHTTIHVTLVESATGQLLGHSDLPIDQLPASFEASTTLHIGAQDWHVDKAEPMTADKFGHTGALRLTLSRVSYMDPKKILFTLPTLDDTVPHPDGRITAQGCKTLTLHEDDWRQIEFVSARRLPEIEAELADIETIYREHSVDNGRFLGFRQIHMRKRIPLPIDPPLTREDTQAALGAISMSFDAVSFERMPGVAPASFAFQVGKLTVYGAGEANTVRCLCILRSDVAPQEPTLAGMQRLMSAHQLYLVDWCRIAAIAPSDTRSLERYFSDQ